MSKATNPSDSINDEVDTRKGYTMFYDEIDEIVLKPAQWNYDDYKIAKQKLLNLKAKWERESYKKGYIQCGVDEMVRTEKARKAVEAELRKDKPNE